MKRGAAVAPELPGYTFVRVLGAGGFSDVFLYDQRLPRRPVAVKVLLGEAESPTARRQFTDEANLMAALSTHPSIVTIYHADVAGDGRPYFVMEYCSGPNLSVRYKAERFGVEETLRVGVKIAGAVATAHAAGILHRDIKPANILTNDFGGPALTDFGISATEFEDAGQTTTLAQLAGGTGTGSSTIGLSVPWSPPEMFVENPQPDVRADIFSLGATLYTLLAGRTPFERPGSSNSQLDLAGRIQRGDVTPMGRDDIPQSLVGVLEKAMAPRRENRYARMVDFGRALQSVEIELGYSPTLLELPQLHSDIETARPVDDPDAGETRVSTVRDVVAQPSTARPQFSSPAAAAAPVAVPAPVGVAPVAPAGAAPPVVAPRQPAAIPVAPQEHPPVEYAPVESTVVRPPAQVEPQPLPEGRPARRGIRSRGVLIGLGAAALAVVGAVVLGVVLNQGPPTPGKTEITQPDSPLGELPPPPTGVSLATVPDPSGTGTDVTATWAPGDATPEVTFYLAMLRGSQVIEDGETAETTFTFGGQSDVSGLCVEVYAVRSGARSVEPAQECLP